MHQACSACASHAADVTHPASMQASACVRHAAAMGEIYAFDTPDKLHASSFTPALMIEILAASSGCSGVSTLLIMILSFAGMTITRGSHWLTFCAPTTLLLPCEQSAHAVAPVLLLYVPLQADTRVCEPARVRVQDIHLTLGAVCCR